MRTAPGIPSEAGVRTISAPKALISRRRSRLMLSGMVTISRYPRAAQVKARAIPVLPLVGSTTTVPGLSLPWASASSIMATPMRSFTDHMGLALSSLAATVALAPSTSRRSLMRGVPPITCVTSSNIRP